MHGCTSATRPRLPANPQHSQRGAPVVSAHRKADLEPVHASGSWQNLHKTVSCSMHPTFGIQGRAAHLSQLLWVGRGQALSFAILGVQVVYHNQAFCELEASICSTFTSS